MKYTRLTIDNTNDLLFGEAPYPLRTESGMVLGGGEVYPELNFTLPPMILNEETFPKVMEHYHQIVADALRRAAELKATGVQLECETLPPMTENPAWAETIARILLDGMKEAEAKWGIKSVLRFTPNDNREMMRPPVMRSGKYWETMQETFERVCALGVDMISIESVGGKEVHDTALMYGDIRQVLFALCILGVRDMKFLWEYLVNVSRKHGVIPAGDSACGFGNTAMVLAEQNLIPRVFAAVVRPLTAIRTLVAHECGAVGPGKDCAYENPILKAITGYPMAMEGKTAACAHLSPLGNIAAATCDLWSNESVQNIKLLGGMAPTCYMEQLIYDCRLFNRARASGKAGALQLRNWLVESDAPFDAQAYVLTPENAIAFSRAIVSANSYYEAGKAVILKAVELLQAGVREQRVRIPPHEISYLETIKTSIAELPEQEESFIAAMMDEVDTTKFTPAEYGL